MKTGWAGGVSTSQEETIKFGQELSKYIENGDIIALLGNLGAGKTTLVKGILEGFGYTKFVTSPTYTMINEYTASKNIIHIDCYKENDLSIWISLGLNDYIIAKGSSNPINFNMPEISTEDAMLWISKIDPVFGQDNQFELTFSIFAVKEIKSLAFSLNHKKFDWIDTTFVPQSFSSNSSNNYTEKFLDDISIYEINILEDETQLSMNYGYGITSNIDFVNSESISLSEFIDVNRNTLISNGYTQLVLHLHTENSTIDEFGATLILSGIADEELQPLISINISQSDESVVIPMSTLLQKYINGQYVNYDGFELGLDGSKYNFSNIILMNSAYLEIVNSK